MKLRRPIFVVALFLYPLATPIMASGQLGTEPSNQSLEQASGSARPHITFEEYVTQVLRSNLALAIEKSNVDLSKAAVTTAKVTPDWSVDVGSPVFDISNQGQPTNFSTALNVPIELGGKRGKRVHAALADVSTAAFDYDDTVRQLRATAASAFIASLSARDLLQSSYKSLGQFDRIVEVNQQRVRVGDIGNIELMQSQVDRDQFKIGVITAQADVYSADLALAQELGQADKLSAQMPVPTGRLEVPVRTFDVDALVAGALQKRSDVLSRQRAVQAAELRIGLAQANLVPDLGMSGSYSHTGTGTAGFVQPPDNTLGASLSINLPFSRWRHQGELETARASRTQAELQLRAAQIQVESEVRDAYSRYQASVERLKLYQAGVLKEADRVLEGRLYAYQRGGATLLEVIDAQRTSANIYLAYSQALADHANALVTLEAAAAMWDVSF
jgi:cobalt-zinc-cadmium efflux system outer membrane protein